MTAALSSVDPRAVVAAARGWIGTPYVHQASARGAGADCLGLLRGVWREVIGPEPERPPAYTPDWSEATRDERLARAAARHLTRKAGAAPVHGDVLLFRMREVGPAKHLAIFAGDGPEGPTIIHAYSGRGVIESPLGAAWSKRVAAVFGWPPLTGNGEII